MLDQIYTNAQHASKILKKFVEKQQYKPTEFLYIPKDNDEYLQSIVLFETNHALVLEDIVTDLNLNAPPLAIFEYVEHITKLSESMPIEQMLDNYIEYKDWLVEQSLV